MNLKDRLARMENRARTLGDRMSQVERNTARIEELEEQMRVVIAALPKIKGIL